jgi:hypothetical protein
MLGEDEKNLELKSAPKETLNVGKSKIYLIWRAKKVPEDHGKNITKYKDRMETEIVEITKNTNILDILNSIAFVIERNEDRNAYINPKEGRVVHLSGSFIATSLGKISQYDRITGSEKENNFADTIRHELVHLVDGQKQDFIEKKEYHLDRLNDIQEEEEKKLETIGVEIKRHRAVSLMDLRSFITAFIHRIRAEGLAKYYEKIDEIQENEEFFGKTNEDKFDKLYSMAEKAIKPSYGYSEDKNSPKNVLKALEKINEAQEPKNIQKLKENIETNLLGKIVPYKVGLHVVYTLLYFDDDPFGARLPIQKIISLGPFEMISEYEKRMLKHEKKPLITVNSGKGKIDYNRIIQHIGESLGELIDVKK